MSDRAFIAQLEGHGMTTVEIHYYRPVAPSLLQRFVWQEYDLAPDSPGLFDFLDVARDRGGASLCADRARPMDPAGRMACRKRCHLHRMKIEGERAIAFAPSATKKFSVEILKAKILLPSSFVPGAGFGSGGT